jgi:hypothetical protein
VFALVSLVVFSAGAGAGNNQAFPDPVGDYERASDTAYASDITQVQATSADNGDTKIATTLADGVGHMSSGDELDIYVNVDRSASTGSNGFDIVLVARGTSSTPDFQLCRFTQPVTCEAGLQGFGADRAAGNGVHVVEFNLRTATAAVDMYAVSSFPRPGGGNPLIDRAPDTGVYTYSIGADGDNDGVYGYEDLCPTKPARGVNDSNDNGCPGPFKSIKALRRQVAVPFPGFLHLRRLSFVGTIPRGARIVLSGAGRTERLTLGRGGARSKRFQRNLRYGSILKLRITKPGWIGFYAKYTVTRRGGVVTKSEACIPAVGRSKPTKCTKALRGK